MAAFNAANTIEDSVDSIRSQDYVDWELVIVDDCSTDRTHELLDQYRSDKRIRIIRLTQNVGGARARMRGIEASGSEFIAIQDADDVALPHRLSRQVAEFDADSELSVVGGQVMEFGSWGGPRSSYVWPTDSKEIRWRLQSGRSPVADCAAMIRRSSFQGVGGYDLLLRRAYDLGLYLAMRDMKFSAVPENVLHYRTIRPIPFSYCIAEGRYRRLAIERHLHGSATSVPVTIPISLLTDLRSILVCLMRRWRERKSN